MLQLIQKDVMSPLTKSTAYTNQVHDLESGKDDAQNVAKSLSHHSPADGFVEEKHDMVNL